MVTLARRRPPLTPKLDPLPPAALAFCLKVDRDWHVSGQHLPKQVEKVIRGYGEVSHSAVVPKWVGSAKEIGRAKDLLKVQVTFGRHWRQLDILRQNLAALPGDFLKGAVVLIHIHEGRP